jgi:hypothetical protein
VPLPPMFPRELPHHGIPIDPPERKPDKLMEKQLRFIDWWGPLVDPKDKRSDKEKVNEFWNDLENWHWADIGTTAGEVAFELWFLW